MPSLVELAELSKAAYEDRGDATFEHLDMTRSWFREDPQKNRLGFYSCEFVCGPERVLAFRGTDDPMDLIIDDVAIARGQMPPQLVPAYLIARRSEAQVVTGHSLGGALALLVGPTETRRAVTFNAPGVLDECMRFAITTGDASRSRQCLGDEQAINVRITADPVSSIFTTGRQVGGMDIELRAPGCGFDLLCRHGIDTCIQQLRLDVENFRPLQL